MFASAHATLPSRGFLGERKQEEALEFLTDCSSQKIAKKDSVEKGKLKSEACCAETRALPVPRIRVTVRLLLSGLGNAMHAIHISCPENQQGFQSLVSLRDQYRPWWWSFSG